MWKYSLSQLIKRAKQETILGMNCEFGESGQPVIRAIKKACISVREDCVLGSSPAPRTLSTDKQEMLPLASAPTIAAEEAGPAIGSLADNVTVFLDLLFSSCDSSQKKL